MLVRCAVLMTCMGLFACSGASSTGFFDAESNATDPGGDAGPKALGPKGAKDGGADGAAEAVADAGGADTQDAAPAAKACALSVTLPKDKCHECWTGACCTQWKACDKNPDCLKLYACVTKCNNDESCIQTCAFLYPDGGDDVVAVYDCGEKSCLAQCE